MQTHSIQVQVQVLYSGDLVKIFDIKAISNREAPLIFLCSVAGIENPAFMPEMDTPPPMRPPPWLNEPEADAGVAPSQRAQRSLPFTPSQIRRLAPLRVSTRSDDSFAMADVIFPQDDDPEDPPPHQGGSQM